jgi:hypothetical protein
MKLKKRAQFPKDLDDVIDELTYVKAEIAAIASLAKHRSRREDSEEDRGIASILTRAAARLDACVEVIDLKLNPQPEKEVA